MSEVCGAPQRLDYTLSDREFTVIQLPRNQNKQKSDRRSSGITKCPRVSGWPAQLRWHDWMDRPSKCENVAKVKALTPAEGR
jgi:hypothetical protein